MTEAFAGRCSVDKVFLEISQNSQGNKFARVSFLIKLQAQACNFIKKEILAQMFSCQFCKISKNSFSDKKKVLLIVVCIKIFNNDICVIDNALFDIDLTSTKISQNLRIVCVFLSCHIRVQSESTFCSSLNIKELFARSKRDI